MTRRKIPVVLYMFEKQRQLIESFLHVTCLCRLNSWCLFVSGGDPYVCWFCLVSVLTKWSVKWHKRRSKCWLVFKLYIFQMRLPL